MIARRGTPAENMTGQISKQEKSDRVRRLSAIEDDLRREYFDRLVGRHLQVLVQSNDGDEQFGTSCRYAPVQLDNASRELGEITTVAIESNEGDRLVGVAVE